MNTCLFVSDLHGKKSRYEALLKIIKKEKPDFVFIGGDLLPHKNKNEKQDSEEDFITDFLFRKFSQLKEKMDCNYPDIFIIPGNDDQKIRFSKIVEGEKADLWRNLHNRCVVIGKYRFYGYACVPPTPFKIKDWERLDISADINPGCIAPINGFFSFPPDFDPEKDTIQNELSSLIGEDNLDFSVFLFHSPPFQTVLDYTMINNHYPKEELSIANVGSKAIRAFIDERQPYITLHGHIHESVGITGEWKQILGRTLSFSAAHDGPELSVVKYDLHDPMCATRRLIRT